MKQVRNLCFLMILVMFYIFLSDNIKASIISNDLKIYNFSYSEKYIVMEYSKIIDNNEKHYISLYDTNSGTLSDIKNNYGEIINSDLFFPSISNDGKYVTFTSRATNITDEQIDKCYDIMNKTYDYCNNIYLYDINSKKSILIKNNGELLNGDSYVSKISGDGNSIIFESSASNLLTAQKYSCQDLNGIDNCINIYKYNIHTRQMSLISTNYNNFGGNRNSINPSISEDGRYVVFQTNSSNIGNLSNEYNNCLNNVSNLMEPCSNIYLVDTINMYVEIISKNNSVPLNDNSGNAIITDNANFIVYETYANNIHQYANSKKHIMLYNTRDKTSVVITKNNEVLNNRDNHLQDISDNGKYIIYTTNSTNLLASNYIMNIYVYNSNNTKTSLLYESENDIEFAAVSEKNVYLYDDEKKIIKCSIDSFPPTIQEGQIIYILKDNTHTIKSKINISDNLSSNTELEVYLKDVNLLSSPGQYNINVTVVDEFQNIAQQIVEIVVIEKDEEGPIFNDANNIKILKGSSQLNLLDYVNAVDKIDGNVRIYIIDDDNLDLDTTGEYTLKIMAKDNSDNITYKEIKVIVYDNYNFTFFYEILVILVVIVGIIILLIKVK